MKKNRIIILIAFMSMSLIGIIFLQAYWIKNSLEIYDKQFSQSTNSALITVANAISDREMKLFLSPAPVLSDDESVWRDWIRTKMVMEQELQKRLRKRLNINSPEDQKQMVLFDDIEKNIAAQKIEAEERKDMEMLREKRRRMQAGPSANRRFK